MSFFDDEDEEPPTTVRPAHTQQQQRPQPRRPESGAGRADGTGRTGVAGGSYSIDHHSMMVRRWIAAGIGMVLLILMVLLVSGCLKRGKQQALESYEHNVNQIAQLENNRIRRLDIELG